MKRRTTSLLALLWLLHGSPARAEEPYARPNRFAIRLGFGLGSASLDRLHVLSQDLRGFVERQSPARLEGAPRGGLQTNVDLSLRYYFPYHVLAEVGYAVLYNAARSGFTAGGLRGTVDNYNLMMEIPLLVGGYVPVHRRIYLHGSVGPSFFFFTRSYWDSSVVDLTDFKAPGGVGLHARAGADFFLASSFAVGVEVRYRHLQSGELQESRSGTAVRSGALRGDGSNESYALDLSGVGFGVHLTFFAR